MYFDGSPLSPDPSDILPDHVARIVVKFRDDFLAPSGDRSLVAADDGQGSLRIGNTRGATLEIDGAQVPLAHYTVGNVAHVKLGDQQPH